MAKKQKTPETLKNKGFKKRKKALCDKAQFITESNNAQGQGRGRGSMTGTKSYTQFPRDRKNKKGHVGKEIS